MVPLCNCHQGHEAKVDIEETANVMTHLAAHTGLAEEYSSFVNVFLFKQ
jgi:hypothetical protein